MRTGSNIKNPTTLSDAPSRSAGGHCPSGGTARNGGLRKRRAKILLMRPGSPPYCDLRLTRIQIDRSVGIAAASMDDQQQHYAAAMQRHQRPCHCQARCTGSLHHGKHPIRSDQQKTMALSVVLRPLPRCSVSLSGEAQGHYTTESAPHCTHPQAAARCTLTPPQGSSTKPTSDSGAIT